jgi:hypothetical protein
MRKRLIGFLLALCYLSVSLSFSSPHSHHHTEGLSNDCAICAWHSESVTDEPAGPVLVAAVEVVIAPAAALELRAERTTSLVHSARGPPLFS